MAYALAHPWFTPDFSRLASWLQDKRRLKTLRELISTPEQSTWIMQAMTNKTGLGKESTLRTMKGKSLFSGYYEERGWAITIACLRTQLDMLAFSTTTVEKMCDDGSYFNWESYRDYILAHEMIVRRIATDTHTSSHKALRIAMQSNDYGTHEYPILDMDPVTEKIYHSARSFVAPAERTRPITRSAKRIEQ